MVDYEYYKNVYLGNTIAEADFPRLSSRAEAYLTGVLDVDSEADGYDLAMRGCRSMANKRARRGNPKPNSRSLVPHVCYTGEECGAAAIGRRPPLSA